MDKDLRRNILKGSAATSIGTISGMVFQFLTILFVARYYSKSDFGLYTLIIVFVNMFNLFGGLGLELTMVKSIASDITEEKFGVLSPVLILRLIGSLIFSAFLIIGGKYLFHLFSEDLYNYIYYIILIFILANFRDLFYNLMQGLNQFKQYSLVNVTSSIFRFILVLFFIFIKKIDLQSLLIIEVLSTLQPMIHQLIVIPFKPLVRKKPTFNTFKGIIKFSSPLYLNNIVTFANSQLNIFIIGLYLTPASIANFDIASKVPMALKKILQSFIIVYFPNLSKLFSKDDKNNAINLIEKSITIFTYVLSIIIISVFLFRNEITVLLFSSKYIEVSLAFALLILNFLIRGAGDLMGYSLVSAGHPSIPSKINIVGTIISVFTGLLLIPRLGYMGAVYALLLMNLISTSLFYLNLKKYNINPSIRGVLKPLIIFFVIPLSLLFNNMDYITNLLILSFCIITIWIISKEFRNILRMIIIYLKKKIFKTNFI